jgi:hypothetical protein
MENDQTRLMHDFGAMVAQRLHKGLSDISVNHVLSAIRVRNIMEYGTVREEEISEGAREQAISLMNDAGYTPDFPDVFGQPMGEWAQSFLEMALLLMPDIADRLEQKAIEEAESVISGEPLKKRIPLEMHESLEMIQEDKTLEEYVAGVKFNIPEKGDWVEELYPAKAPESDESDKPVFCGTCSIVLNNRQEYVEHIILNHEDSAEYAQIMMEDNARRWRAEAPESDKGIISGTSHFWAVMRDLDELSKTDKAANQEYIIRLRELLDEAVETGKKLNK